MFDLPVGRVMIALGMFLVASRGVADDAAKSGSADSEPIALWPGVAPGDKGDIGEENTTRRNTIPGAAA